MLFDLKQFDTAMFNGGTTVATVYSTDPVVFNSFSVSDNTNMVLTNLTYSGPTRVFLDGDVPRAHGKYLTASYFRETTITASGYVIQSTAAALDAYLDTIRKNLYGQEMNLDLTDTNGTVKRFVATVANFEKMFAQRKGYHITTCPFTIEFVCKTPFGKARTYSSTELPGITTNSNQSVVNAGTAPALPVFILVFTAANTVTVININNTTTGEQIQYSGTAAANDVFEFDSEQKTVTKNGSAVNFTGAFPTLNPGANIVSVSITGTSFTADFTLSHKTTYL